MNYVSQSRRVAIPDDILHFRASREIEKSINNEEKVLITAEKINYLYFRICPPASMEL